MQVELALFVSDEEALAAAVHHCGGTKQVAGRLWPDLPQLTAQKKLLDALNVDRDARLKPSQVRMILTMAREAGYHAAAQWFMGEVGYEVKVVDPVAREDRALAVLDRAAADLARAVDQVNRIRAGRMLPA